MAKQTIPYWNPLQAQNSDQWIAMEGTDGMIEQLTLTIDEETGDYTRLTRFKAGADTSAFGPQVHDYPEEIWIVSGELYDQAFDRWLEPGDYASRPPGEIHGSFQARSEVIVLEMSYPSQRNINRQETVAGLAPTANYQYAQQVGPQLFVAGQVPHDPEGNLVGLDNPAAQTIQCLQNLQTLITLYGFKTQDIRHLKIYVVGESENLTQAWQAVTTWFDNHVPPATLLGVALLGYDNQLVEIDVTIVKNP